VSATRHPDRQHLPAWLAVGLGASTAVMGALLGNVVVAYRGGDPALGLGAGAVVALLVLWGLPSLSLALLSRLLVTVSAGAMSVFGTLDPVPHRGIELVAGWLGAAVATLALAARVTAGTVPAAPEERALPPARARVEDRRRAVRAGSQALLLAAVAVFVLLLVAPVANEHVAAPVQVGQGPAGDATGTADPLRASARLDMTRRPELSDEVLLTVRADRRTFLRGEVFDVWDGGSWHRSDSRAYPVVDGAPFVARHDLAGDGPVSLTQRIRVEAPIAEILVAAPTAVEVEAAGDLLQSADGTLLPRPRPLGRGAVYTVTSRSFPLDEAGLRADDGPIHPEIRARYAAEPATTDRVRRLAESIGAEAGATTAYDRIRAFEAWMGDHVAYSIDAPPSPRGTDAVDHFLFESKLGWCEQIASSLVVLARSQGIPARLATGFVPGERDRASGDLVVRGTDAHAWAEVWFPSYGWVAFDPTADVSLAPTPDRDRSLADLVRTHLTAIVGVALAVAVGGWALRGLARLVRRRRAARPATAAAALDRDLDRLGRRCGLAREPAEPAGAFAERLAVATGAAGVAAAGALVDDHLYRPDPPPPEAIERAREALAAARRTTRPAGG